jgi:hypothetical protein
MPKIELKGTIFAVESPTVVGDKNTDKQLFYLKTPPYTDAFGTVMGKEKLWQISIIGESVRKFSLDNTYEGKKAILSCYVDSNYIEPKIATSTMPARSEMYIINLNLASITLK